MRLTRIHIPLVVVMCLCGLVVTVMGELEVYRQPIVVPRCCEFGFNMDGEFKTCTADPNKPFHPMGVVGNSTMELRNVQNEEETPTICTEGEQEMYANASRGEVALVVAGSNVGLYWFSPEGGLHQPSTFCMARQASYERNEKPHYIAKFCLQDPALQQEIDDEACFDSTCVRKCCAPGKLIVSSGRCEPSSLGEDWQPSLSGNLAPPPSDLKIVHGLPYACNNLLTYDDHLLLPSGNLLASDIVVSHKEYCIDHFHDENSGTTVEMALVCFRNLAEMGCAWKNRILKPILLSVSCVCLALTWGVYICVKQLRTSTMGRCLLSYISALFVAFVTIMVLQTQIKVTPDQCSATGRISHFSILAAFCWLSVMSYHIFFTFRSGVRGGGREGGRAFLWYSIYAWGIPMLVVLLGLILDLTQAPVIRPDMLPPNCWFVDKASKWAYQYSLILVVLVVNLGFFLGSVQVLRGRAKCSTDQPSHGISVWVYVKLFVIMGLLWITEVIIWQFTMHCSIPNTIFDVVNGLQGLYVFLVAVCFRKDLKVFHCGLPQYVPVCGEDDEVGNPYEVSDLVGQGGGGACKI